MTKLVAACRVTVICDTVLENMLLEEFTKLGATGYTCMDCKGNGRHYGPEGTDPFATELPLVRIELIVRPDVADKMVDYLHREMSTNYASIACVEKVEVASSQAI